MSPDEKEARTHFHELMEADQRQAKNASGMTVRKLCDTCLDRTRDDKSDERYATSSAT